MGNILQLKITLRGSKPPIWRRILIKDHITFQELHQIIQDTMGWYNCHLYEFNLGGISIGVPYEDAFDEIIDSSKIKIKKYLNRKGDKILYNYDFGDDWQHLISIEKVVPVIQSEKYPKCIKGKGNCPPEDCGGIWGYHELLEKIKNKNHPEHEEMLEWLGGKFDPEEFDMERINQNLEKYQ